MIAGSRTSFANRDNRRPERSATERLIKIVAEDDIEKDLLSIWVPQRSSYYVVGKYPRHSTIDILKNQADLIQF